MKTIMNISVLLIFILTSGYSQDAREIVRRADEKMRGEVSSIIEMTMTTERPRYTRETSMKVWTKGEEFSMILVTAPARDRGTGFLKRGNEIWNYVPNIDRTIKLPPSMMSQSWMGSDFTNDDLVRESSVIQDFSHNLLRSEIIDGHDCHVIEMIPKPESSVVYDKVVVWITKDTYNQLKIENYDEYGDLVNTIQMSEIKNLGGRELPTVLEMIPADKPGNKTILRYISAEFDKPMQDSFFSLQNLRSLN